MRRIGGVTAVPGIVPALGKTASDIVGCGSHPFEVLAPRDGLVAAASYFNHSHCSVGTIDIGCHNGDGVVPC